MPTYQYRCSECGHEFEEMQTITADPITECPNCSGKVQRVISGGGGFLFKGTGFYITDYRDSKYKEASKKEKDSALPESKSKDKKSNTSDKSTKKTDSTKSTNN